jgi:hypothetical protein
MSEIDLMLDEENELTFQLDVEGTRPGDVECRLTLEGSDISLIFKADSYKGEEVNVVLPPLEHVLKEGKYDMSLEVLVDDRMFVPLVVEGNFTKSIKVSAAPKVERKVKKSKPSASLVEVTSSAKSKNSKNSSKSENKEKPRKHKVSDDQIMEIIKLIQSKK